jgi:hypothetical protein
MKSRFRSIYVSAIAVVGTALLGSFFISTADAHGWDKQRMLSETKKFIVTRHVLHASKVLPDTTQAK